MTNTNNLADTQLARIVAPNISDPTYANDLSNAFEIINENFRKLASAPFLQGVKGDSYQLQAYPIFKNGLLTEEGAILLNSIFSTTKFLINDTYDNCVDKANGIAPVIGANSALSCFRNGSTYVNNYVYFQEIVDDANNVVSESKTYGQLFYFVDGRLKDAGSALEDDTKKSELSSFCDYSGFYQYDNSDPSNKKYIKLSLMPSIYYDENQNNICWMFNGIKTGISAVGATGRSGNDASLAYVLVNRSDQSVFSNEPDKSTKTTISAVGVLDNNIGFMWNTNRNDFDDLLDINGTAIIFIEYKDEKDKTNTKIYHDYAFGKVYKSDNGWQAAYTQLDVIQNLVSFDAINEYFENMHKYDDETPFRQHLQIPISPYKEQAYGTHIIGTCCKGNSDDTNNGSFLVHRNSDIEEGIEKNFIISNYEKLELKKYNFDGGKTGSLHDKSGVTISRGSTGHGPIFQMVNAAGKYATFDMTKDADGLNIGSDTSTNPIPVKLTGSLEIQKGTGGSGDFTAQGNSLVKGNSEIIGTAKVGNNVTILGNNITIGSGNNDIQIKQASTGSFKINVPNAIYVFNDVLNNPTKKAHLYVNGDIKAEKGDLVAQGNLQVKGGATAYGGRKAVIIGDPNNKTSTGETNDEIILGLTEDNSASTKIHSNIRGFNGEQKSIVTTIASDPNGKFKPDKIAEGDTYGSYGSYLYLVSGANNYFSANVGINVQNVGESKEEKCVRIKPKLQIEGTDGEISDNKPEYRLIVNGNSLIHGTLEIKNGINVTGPAYISPKFAYTKGVPGEKSEIWEKIDSTTVGINPLFRPIYVPRKAYPAMWLNTNDEKTIFAFPSDIYTYNSIVIINCIGDECGLLKNVGTIEYCKGQKIVWLSNTKFTQNGRTFINIFNITDI